MVTEQLTVDGHRVVSVAEAGRDLVASLQQLVDDVWPRFIQEASVAGYSEYDPDWFGVYSRWPQFQFGLLDPAGELVAVGNGLSFAWHNDTVALPDGGWDWVMDKAAHDHRDGLTPNTFCGLSVTIRPDRRRQGLSRTVLRTMSALARQAGLSRVVVPVRPMLKDRYPLIPMADYMIWTYDGLPFDPWLRTHVRLGGHLVKPCNRSMTMGGRVEDWERWCGVKLPGGGDHVLPGLLAPLHVNYLTDRCVYVEPNVWLEHSL